jgi:hypothetical protein
LVAVVVAQLVDAAKGVTASDLHASQQRLDVKVRSFAPHFLRNDFH